MLAGSQREEYFDIDIDIEIAHFDFDIDIDIAPRFTERGVL